MDSHRFLSDSELELLFQSGGERHYLWLSLGCDAGLRVCEILQLSPDHVLPSGWLWVRSKKRTRRIPMPSRLVQAVRWADMSRLARNVPTNRPYLKRCSRTVQRWFRRLAQEAGVYVPGRTPHSLRHSYAMRLVRAGVPLHLVQTLLGHRRLGTTSVYLHPGERDLEAAARALDEGAWGSACRVSRERRHQVGLFPADVPDGFPISKERRERWTREFRV